MKFTILGLYPTDNFSFFGVKSIYQFKDAFGDCAVK